MSLLTHEFHLKVAIKIPLILTTHSSNSGSMDRCYVLKLCMAVWMVIQCHAYLVMKFFHFKYSDIYRHLD